MKKRIFIGIFPNNQLLKKIELWKIKNNSLVVRWIKKENIHLTLIPPWYTEDFENEIKKLEFLHPLIVPFSLNFSRIETGPTKSNSRLIWVKSERDDIILNLKQSLEKLFGKSPEKRRFVPHITIARFTKNTKIEIEENISWKQKVVNFSLIESVLKKEGAEYKKIFTFKFSSHE